MPSKNNIFRKEQLISLKNDTERNLYSYGANATIIAQRDINLKNLGGNSVNGTEFALQTMADPTVAQAFDRLFETMSKFVYEIESDDKQVEEFINAQILEEHWSILFEGLGLAKLTGIAAIEPIWAYLNDKIVIEEFIPVDSKRIVFSQDSTQSKPVAKFTTINAPLTGEDIPPQKIIINTYFSAYIDSPYGLGIGGLLVELVELKRQILDLAVKIANRQAIPIKIGSIPDNAPAEEVDSFFECLKAMQNSSVFVLPEKFSLDVKDIGSSGLSDIVFPLLDYLEAQINSLVLGESITGKDLANGSQSRDNIASDITNTKAYSLAKDVASTLNKTVVKWLCLYNFPGKTAKIKVKNPENQLEQLEVYLKLKDLGLKLDPNWLAEKFNVKLAPERKALGSDI